ncbi:GbsR/MarR family transcriptional regulator [Haloferula sargassicola]|uniref:HTH-type transcriptional regulator n=1 Tax=Haloferula sargassicola TaxID=490096 RepID=A0ABP9UQF5_9BACT
MPAADSSTLETEAADTIAAYFCRMADTLGLPRSTALIYHTLFLTDEALSYTEIVERSGLSKASASTGLKLLERAKAVEIVIVPASRATHYKAELSLRRLAAGLVQETLMPGFKAGGHYLEQLPDLEKSDAPILNERISRLRHWHQLAHDLVPLLSALGPTEKAES